MKRVYFEITENIPIAPSVYKITLSGDASDITRAGQFVNVKIDGLYLRRPVSVCDFSRDALTMIYKVVGKGTEKLSTKKPGEMLDVLSGLGNGYTLDNAGKRPLLIGGGVGVPPLYGLAKELKKLGAEVSVILGFNTKSEIFYREEFEQLGAKVLVTTADGSYGIKGFVTDALGQTDYTYFYACGPEPMLKAVYKNTVTDGQFSFEERMGCGFGACMGCSCKTVTGYKRICKDGPVLEKGEILW